MSATPQSNASLADIASFLKANDAYVLCGHVGPDGDCLGSQLALWHALRALGKTASCILVSDEPVAACDAFMPGVSDMVYAGAYDGPAEVFIGLDVPTRARIGEPACAILDACAHSITIDHHACDDTMCELVYVDPDAASTSILVWDVVKKLLAEPPVESALCAYAGLVSDTGGFRYQNSDSHAFSAASDMIASGADAAFVAEKVFQSRTVASLNLERLALERMRFVSGGSAVISWVRQEDFEALGARKSDGDAIIDTLRSAQGVKVACVLREQGDVVRGSLRAKGEIDVSSIARELGGGGHKAAAGFSVEPPLEAAIDLLEQKIASLLEAE